MYFQKTRAQLTDTYNDFPKPFWTLVVVTFIDRLGGALLFPFFALYITSKFNVGMTQVGVLFAAFSFSSFVGTILGGALTDRLGRKGMLIFSLVSTSISAVLMGLVDTLSLFFVVALLVGIFTDAGGPAYEAMVADLLPESKRAQGYGILRVAFNVSVVIGPAIGGFLATRSYLALFITDAVISLISATIVWRAMPETRPDGDPDQAPESVLDTFRGYLQVLRDSTFILYLGAVMLMSLVYMNMSTTLGVYLRDIHHVPESGYGWILSLNAVMVVLFQFPLTRKIERRPPMLMMALGAALYAIGFAMYGFVSLYVYFMLAMVVITIGEMFVAPVGRAIVAKFAPEHMRGRYMAVSGFSFLIPFAVGPLLAGIVLDTMDPRLLWYLSGVVGMFSVAGFLWLHRRVDPAQVELSQGEALSG